MQEMTHRYTDDLLRLAFEQYDNCIFCGYRFKEGDTTHLGYGPQGEPLYVCDSCSGQLEETAVRHYFSPRPYEIPPSHSQLWRYMDFTKYVSLLSNSGLYFARADTFEDHFEGAKGLRSQKGKWDEFHLSFFTQGIKNPPEGYTCEKSEKQIDLEAERLLTQLEEVGTLQREQVFISCWHENKHESEAMWRLYSSYLDNAVAIRTTYSSLYRSLGRNPSIQIGRVKYIDFDINYAGVNNCFWRKRKSFEHENEVRAIIHDYDCEVSGKIVKCNLDTLVEEVFVSPSAPVWFTALVNDVNQKFGLDVKVSSSRLNEKPFY